MRIFRRACIRVALLFETVFYLRIYGISAKNSDLNITITFRCTKISVWDRVYRGKGVGIVYTFPHMNIPSCSGCHTSYYIKVGWGKKTFLYKTFFFPRKQESTKRSTWHKSLVYLTIWAYSIIEWLSKIVHWKFHLTRKSSIHSKTFLLHNYEKIM